MRKTMGTTETTRETYAHRYVGMTRKTIVDKRDYKRDICTQVLRYDEKNNQGQHRLQERHMYVGRNSLHRRTKYLLCPWWCLWRVSNLRIQAHVTLIKVINLIRGINYDYLDRYSQYQEDTSCRICLVQQCRALIQ